jgi:hypothetical protein
MKTNKKGKVLRIIGITAAALTACAGAVCLFLKRKAIKRNFTAFFMIAAVISCCLMMCGMTAYAAPEQTTEPDTQTTETEYDYDTEPDEVIIGEETEIDIGEFLDPEKQPNQLTPPGNLTLVDDLSGAQADEKQFITVTTKNGNYFYIIIDRTGSKENVYFLNLVDEYDLLALLEDEKADKLATPPGTSTVTPNETPGQSEPPGETPAPQPKNNTIGLLIMTLIIAAVGGGAFYYFKVLKPKQGGNKKGVVKSELDEFAFDPDDDDLFNDNGGDTGGQDNPVYENDGDIDDGEVDEDIPDFTAADDTEPDNNGDDFNIDFSAETQESEGDE